MAMKLAGSAAFLVAGVTAEVKCPFTYSIAEAVIAVGANTDPSKGCGFDPSKADAKLREVFNELNMCAYTMNGAGAPVFPLPKGESPDCCNNEQVNRYAGSAKDPDWSEPVTKDFTDLSGALSFYTQDKEGSKKVVTDIMYTGPGVLLGHGGFANPFISRPDRPFRASWQNELRKFSMTRFSPQVTELKVGDKTYNALRVSFKNDEGQSMVDVLGNMEDMLKTSCVAQSQASAQVKLNANGATGNFGNKTTMQWTDFVSAKEAQILGKKEAVQIAIDECQAFSAEIAYSNEILSSSGIIAKCDDKFMQDGLSNVGAHIMDPWPILDSVQGTQDYGGVIDLSGFPNHGWWTTNFAWAIPPALMNNIVANWAAHAWQTGHTWTASQDLVQKTLGKIDISGETVAEFVKRLPVLAKQWNITLPTTKGGKKLPGSTQADLDDAKGKLKIAIKGLALEIQAKRTMHVTSLTLSQTSMDLSNNEEFAASAQQAYNDLYWPECCCGFSQCCCLATWLSVGGSLFVILSAVVTMFMCGCCDDEGAQTYTKPEEGGVKPEEKPTPTDEKTPTAPEETESKGCGCCVWVIIAIVVVVVIVGLVYCCSGSSNKEMEEESDEDVEP